MRSGDTRITEKRARCAAVLLLAVLLLAGTCFASAETVTGSLSAAYESGRAVRAVGTLTFRRISSLTDTAKELINRLLPRAGLALWAAKDSMGLGLSLDGTEYFSVAEGRTAGGTVTRVNDTAFRAEKGLLWIDGEGFSGLSAALSFREEWTEQTLPRLRELAGRYAEAVEQEGRDRFAHAGNTVLREICTVPAEDTLRMWPELVALIPPFPLEAEQRSRMLRLRFVSEAECVFYRDADGRILAFSMEGEVQYDARSLRMKLSVACSDAGFDFSASLQPETGKDRNRLTVWTQRSETAFSGGMELERRSGGVKRTDSAGVSLKNTEDTFSGRITFATEKGGRKVSWTVTPSFTFSGTDGEGDIDFVRRSNDVIDLSGDIVLTVSAGEAPLLPETDTALTAKEASETAEREGLRSLARIMGVLSPEDMLLFTHELRTDVWMDLTVDDMNDPDVWTVRTPRREDQ